MQNTGVSTPVKAPERAPDNFVNIQSSAVELAGDFDRTVRAALDAGTTNLFFVATGGVLPLMEPAARILQTRSTFPVYSEMAAELVVAGSVHLGPHSLVVVGSLSGTTKETLAAVEYCRERGATVISLTGRAASPVAQAASVNFTVEATDETSSESFYLQTLLIALSLLNARGEFDAYERTVEELRLLPEVLLGVKDAFADTAGQIAERIKDESYHVITGAGSTWPEAFYYGTCILEEMQWIRTRPVHASDFFHGTLEVVEPGVSVIVLRGEDSLRPLADRVERFVRQHTDKIEVIDTADVDMPGISPEVRALISPVVLATMLERISANLEILRDHPLVTRRYYRQIEY